MSTNNFQLKTGAILSYIQMALSVIIGLLYTPIMIRFFGPSEYGLYNTVSSVISMLSVLSLGFNSAYIKYYSVYKTKNDLESIYKLNGLFIIVFSVIGSIALVCGILFTFNLKFIFGSGLTSNEYKIATVLMLLMTCSLSISFPISVFVSIISANERFVFLKLLGIVKTIAGPLITFPLLLLGLKSIAMVTVTLCVSTVVDLIYIFYTVKILKNKFIFRGFDTKVFKSLFSYSIFIAIQMIVDQINWNMDKFLLGRFQGTTSVAIYSVGYSIFNYYLLFSVSISGLFSPRIHQIVNSTKENDELMRNQLTDLFVKVARVQYLILGFILLVFVFYGQPFIRFWAGDEYNNSYYVLLLLAIPATIDLTQNCGIEIQRALNKQKSRSLIYSIMAIINLVASIFLCKYIGEIGAAIGTAISLLIGNGLLINIYYHKRCYIDIKKYWKNIGLISISFILPIIFGVLSMTFIEISSLFDLVFCVFVFATIYLMSIYLFSLNDNEKRHVLFFINLRKK